MLRPFRNEMSLENIWISEGTSENISKTFILKNNFLLYLLKRIDFDKINIEKLVVNFKILII